MNCLLLQTNSGRCKVCSKYRETLHAIASKPKKDNIENISCYTNYRYMSDHQNVIQIKKLKCDINRANIRIMELECKLRNHSQTHGVHLDSYSEGSFPRLFWQTQIMALNQSKKSSICWHPSLIKWCIFLKHKSSSAYELLGKSGFVQLPSQRT